MRWEQGRAEIDRMLAVGNSSGYSRAENTLTASSGRHSVTWTPQHDVRVRPGRGIWRLV